MINTVRGESDQAGCVYTVLTHTVSAQLRELLKGGVAHESSHIISGATAL